MGNVAIAREQTLGQVLRRTAARYPDKDAIICGPVRWTYAEFDEKADAICNGLRREGLASGDRIAVLSRNSHAFAALRFGAARAGVTIVPINFMLKAQEIAYILGHSQVKWLFLDEANREVGMAAASLAGSIERMYGLPSEAYSATPEGLDPITVLEGDSGEPAVGVASADIAQIVYTSGTESRPKGVMLSHEAIAWQYQSCIYELELKPSDRFLHAMPMFHCAQLDTFLGPCIAAGVTNIITFSPAAENVLPLLERHEASSFFAPPTVWIALMQSGRLRESVGTHLAKAYYGASIMPVEVLQKLRGELPAIRFWNCYGQSEIAPLAAVLQPEDHEARAGSVGRTVLNVWTRIVDDEGRDVQVGEVGEIVHRSPQLMTSYLEDPDRTDAAFASGWFHSGDLARRDEDGFLYIVDRKKDMIKTGGENVASAEVENAIHAHPDVAEAAVVGLPDPQWIEAVTAIIVPRSGANLSETELREHCASRLAGFKTPKRFIIVDSLPKNASGKILKRELRQSLISGTS